MVTVGCALVGLGAILGAQVRSIAVELPAYQSTILTKLSDLRQNLKAPGLFDGVLKTFERVQKEVELKDDKPAEGPCHSVSKSFPCRKRRSSRHLPGLCGQRSPWPPPASS